MPSDYARISRENERKYGTDIGRIGPTLLGNRYADRTHFVFELLQNAEDARGRSNGRAGSRRVRFALANGAVRFSHFGERFTPKDVRAICGIVEGTKEDDLTAIGRFGIGFKSVYAVADLPAIHSGDEHFEVRDYVHPRAVAPIPLDDGETVIALPLRERDADAPGEVAEQFERLGEARTLLFLREISEIEWSVEDGPSGCCRREETVEGEGVRRVRLHSEIAGEDPLEESWLVFSRSVQHDGKSAGYTELAFKLAPDGSGEDVIETVDRSRLAAFFPTEIRTDLGILVQGPYRTTPNRETIPWADAWNRHLVTETATLLVDALCYLRDRGLLGVHVFDALPLNRRRFSGHFFEPMFDAVHEAIRSEPLLPAHRGGQVAASQAWLARGQGLRELISREQLATLVGADAPVSWLSDDITADRASRLRSYLMDEHDVREIEAGSLPPLLDKDFLEAQSDEWIRRLYEFLSGQPALRRRFASAPLIRLDDGTHVTPKIGGEPVAYLPVKPPSGYPTVCRPACASRLALAFLKSLDLRRPDPVDEIVNHVLPQYRETDFTASGGEYEQHLQRFLRAFGTDSRERRERLIEALSDTSFVRVVDAGTGERSFIRPEDAYLATRRLRDLFKGVPSVLLVDEPLRRDEVTRLLEACGAVRGLYPVSLSEIEDWDPEQLGEMRKEAGEERITRSRAESLTNWEFRGLDQLLEYLQTLPPEDASDRAGLLWEALRKAASRPGQPGFRARYEWFYTTNRSYKFDSTAVQTLNWEAWVPDGSGGLQPPSRVEFASLGWRRGEFPESIIKFRQPKRPSPFVEFAEAQKIDPEVLAAVIDATREGDLSADELREAVREYKASRASTDSTSRDAHKWGAVSITSGVGDAGNTGGGPTSGGERVFETYIRVERESVGTAEGGPEHGRRMGVEEAAIALILDREPSLKRTPPNNPGFDLYEVGEDELPVRWIEVKALAEGWESHPVTLTHTQFEYAREKGEAYWLYVVEHAGTDHTAIVKINDPAGRASTYTFDKGWRVVAAPAAPPLP